MQMQNCISKTRDFASFLLHAWMNMNFALKLSIKKLSNTIEILFEKHF